MAHLFHSPILPGVSHCGGGQALYSLPLCPQRQTGGPVFGGGSESPRKTPPGCYSESRVVSALPHTQCVWWAVIMNTQPLWLHLKREGHFRTKPNPHHRHTGSKKWLCMKMSTVSLQIGHATSGTQPPGCESHSEIH